MFSLFSRYVLTIATVFYVVSIILAFAVAVNTQIGLGWFAAALALHVVAALAFLVAWRKRDDIDSHLKTIFMQLQTLPRHPGIVFRVGHKNDFLGLAVKSQPERIQSAAILDYKNRVYVGSAPATHDQIRHFVATLNVGPMRNYGWMTTHGRFVYHDEGFEIAVEAGQLIGNDHAVDEVLTPAHLWPQVYNPKVA